MSGTIRRWYCTPQSQKWSVRLSSCEVIDDGKWHRNQISGLRDDLYRQYRDMSRQQGSNQYFQRAGQQLQQPHSNLLCGVL